MQGCLKFHLTLPWLVFLSVLGAGLVSEASPRKLGLSEAVDMALKRSPRIQLATEKLGQAEARRRAARGNLGPTFSVEANLFH